MNQWVKGALPMLRQPPRKERATDCEALHEVFKVEKTMQAEGLNWGEKSRARDRQALAKIVEGVEYVDRQLSSDAAPAPRDSGQRTR